MICLCLLMHSLRCPASFLANKVFEKIEVFARNFMNDLELGIHWTAATLVISTHFPMPNIYLFSKLWYKNKNVELTGIWSYTILILCRTFSRGSPNMADTLQKMSNPKVLREKLTSWDGKINPSAPLSDKQKDSFMELTTFSSSRALPVEVSRP